MALLATLIFLLPKQIEQLDSLFYSGQYPQLIAFADSLIREDTGMVRIQALKFMAFAYIALDSAERAESCFAQVLKENPYFELDPIYTFPKAMKAFQSAKFSVGAAEVPNLDSIKRVLWLNDSLKNELKRRCYSLLFPGLGDYKFGDRKRGKKLMGLTVLSLISIGIAHFAYLHAKDRYMSARTQPEIDRAYKEMDIWYKLRALSAVSLLGLFVYAQF